MRICLVYDCLFPHTVGGAERWYRNLARAARGRGPRGHLSDAAPVGARGAAGRARRATWSRLGPRLGLYTGTGAGGIWPPLVFGAGRAARTCPARPALRRGPHRLVPVLLPAGRRGRAALRALRAASWTGTRSGRASTGASTSGRARAGRPPGAAPLRARPAAGLLLLPAARGPAGGGGAPRRADGARGRVRRAALERPVPEPAGASVVFAGRHIPEKRVPALVEAMPALRERGPELRLESSATGPSAALVERRVAELGARRRGDACTGSWRAEEVDRALRHAVCMVLPSSREGYGMVVVEAAAAGTPSVVVAAPGQRRRGARGRGRERLRRASARPGGPGRGDRPRPRRRARRCASPRPAGSGATRGGCRSRRRSTAWPRSTASSRNSASIDAR